MVRMVANWNDRPQLTNQLGEILITPRAWFSEIPRMRIKVSLSIAQPSEDFGGG
jgi:hypothetical protein